MEEGQRRALGDFNSDPMEACRFIYSFSLSCPHIATFSAITGAPRFTTARRLLTGVRLALQVAQTAAMN